MTYPVAYDVDSPILSERKSSIFTSNELRALIDYSDDEFEVCANRMSITDLDLTQRTMQAEIRVLQGYLEQHHGLDQNE